MADNTWAPSFDKRRQLRRAMDRNPFPALMGLLLSMFTDKVVVDVYWKDA